MHFGVVVKGSSNTRASLAVKEAKAAPGGLTKAGGLTFAYAQVASKIPKSRHLDLPSFGHLSSCVCVCVCTCVHMRACIHVQCV